MTLETLTGRVRALAIPAEAVVVGLDETAAGAQARDWGAGDAALHGRPLILLHALDRAYTSPVEAYEEAAAAEEVRLTAESQAMLAQHEAAVRAAQPDVPVTTAVVRGLPGDLLVEVSRHVGLLVLGGNVRSRLESFLVGSVADVVCARAHCPVVVVRRGPGPSTGPVVVGVDDVEGARGPLTLAFREAQARRAVLEVVQSRAADDGRQQDELRRALAPWSVRYPSVPVDVTVQTDPPAHALVARSEAAQLVVVGTHGRGRLGSAVIGSVSKRLLRDSRCPLAVVRPLPPAST